MNRQPAGTPMASVSLDLDNLWSYMKIHGDTGWEAFPTYLDRLVDIVVDRLQRHELIITVFVVGQDAALERNGEALLRLATQGHEIANHSFSHEPWFHRYSFSDTEREIIMAEEAIERVVGKRPRGYRSPGFSFSRHSLAVLAQRSYVYDASTLPTFIGPLARAYYFRGAAGMSAEQVEQRGQLFGNVGDALRPNRPYKWQLDDDTELLEIPVTTMPLTRLPFHMSYLIYLAGFSRLAFRTYLRTALRLCRFFGVQPSFLLHPLDFLGGDMVKELAFFPGMALQTAEKLDLFDEVVTHLRRHFRLVTMEEQAVALLEAGALESRKP